MVALADTRGQNPLHHFRVGGSGKIGAAQRGMIGEILTGSGDTQPGGIFLESGEELFEPAVLEAMSVGTRPNAEFFHVVTHRRHAAGMQSRCFAQVGDDVFDFAEGDEITERLLTGEEPNALAAIFGDVGPKELLGFKAGGKKMNIIDEGVANAGGGEGEEKLRLPNTLGDPGARRMTPEVGFQVAGETGDLFALVLMRDGDEYRFVKAATDELDLAGVYESL